MTVYGIDPALLKHEFFLTMELFLRLAKNSTVNEIMGKPGQLISNADSTIERKGFNAPMIEHGELQTKVGFDVPKWSGSSLSADYGAEPSIGTEGGDKGAIGEIGDSHQPARPFLRKGLEKHMANTALLLGKCG